MSSAHWEVGFAAMPITPPVGTPLGGYPDQPAARSVRGQLWARAVVIRGQAEAICLISLDLLGVDTQLCDAIRSAAAESTGLRADAVMVVGTHTHSAPACVPTSLWLREPEGDTGYRRHLVEMAATAIAGAWAGARPAQLSVGRGDTGGLVGRNRRDATGEFDPEVTVVLARGQHDTVGTLLHYACHPTVSGQQRRTISPDFPASALHLAEQVLGGLALFVNGAAGDVSTRFTRRVQTDDEADRMGQIVGAAALTGAAASRPLAGGRVYCHREIMTLPVAPPSAEDLDAELEQARRDTGGSTPAEARVVETRIEGLTLRRQAAERLRRLGTVDVELHVLGAGNLLLVGLPGEPFIALSRSLKRDHATVLTAGYANGYIGYIPTSEAFSEGGYEVAMSMLGPEGVTALLARANTLVDEALDQLDEEVAT